jgi:ribosomal protein L31
MYTLVDVGQRSKHALVKDTRTGCHLVLAPPPAEYSREGAGTNHEFKAGLDICSECHGAYNGGQLPDVVEAEMEELK